jgi:glycyl-tRNA synthetase beta chain
VDRELLIEVGCEELPASWLPDLTRQFGEVVVAGLRACRLSPEAPAEAFSTPRRLAVRIAHVPDHQTDLEEVITGPPVSAAMTPEGRPTPAASGFAAKHGVQITALERVETPKGVYLAVRRQERGRAAVDVLPAVLSAALRGLSFPKAMHWDAALDDGHGELLFGRPIRWLLFLYGGRVVPFTITRAPAAESGDVQAVQSGAVTYGHRFLTTSGRAGRSIKVRSFEEYRGRLLENFVILDRAERQGKIARELDSKAQRLSGRVSRGVHGESGLLAEVPDLVEYPSVIAGTVAVEFLSLPEEVLTTTLIAHQHYFPVEGEDGRLKNAFLAVINSEPDNERTIARNAERVVAARLRDARFFWEADRRTRLEARLDRLDTLTFHKKLGSYRAKSERIAELAFWLARDAFGASAATADAARLAARLSKADLTTDMVREFTELQGVMGGIYAREEGLPAEVSKAIYYHYLPAGVEEDAAPSPVDVRGAELTWAAVSLADKLDTIVGLFAAGEKPTGSRDPYGLRRAAHGVVKILADLPSLGVDRTPTLAALGREALRGFRDRQDSAEIQALRTVFWLDRLEHLLRQRAVSEDAIRAVLHRRHEDINPLDVLRRGQAVDSVKGQAEFVALARLFKRVNNIVQEKGGAAGEPGRGRERLHEAAETALRSSMDRVGPEVAAFTSEGRYAEALRAASALAPAVDRFFTEVLVMVDDQPLREARLALLAELRDLVWAIADIPAVVQERN